MLSFKFSYPTKPKEKYKLRYGLDSKSRPYLFNYPTGLVDGRYRFRYDRRGQIHVEDDGLEIVKWGRDIDIDREQEIVKWARNIDIDKEQGVEKWVRNMDVAKLYGLENIINRRVEMEDINIGIESDFYSVYMESWKELEKDFIKRLEVDKNSVLLKIKDKILDIYRDVCFVNGKS